MIRGMIQPGPSARIRITHFFSRKPPTSLTMRFIWVCPYTLTCKRQNKTPQTPHNAPAANKKSI